MYIQSFVTFSIVECLPIWEICVGYKIVSVNWDTVNLYDLVTII